VSETCPELGAAPPGNGFDKSVDSVVYQFLAYRRGEELGHILDQAQLLDFLGEIDTPNEAAMVLWGVGRPVACDALFEQEDGSYFTSGEYTISICPVTTQRFDITVTSSGAVSQEAIGEPVETPVCVGRRPDGLVASAVGVAPTPLAAYLADIARLEASAVIAFAVLERDLAAYGAPSELLRRARAAAADEKRHAVQTSSLARRFGAVPEPARSAVGPVRSLFDIALENATEGCVRELYGAAVARVQSLRAADGEVRRVFERIARDEAEHAALSLAIAHWLDERLSEAERTAIASAKQRAHEQLRAELACEPDSEVVRTLGVPRAREAVALLDAIDVEALAA
jgi:hypothetical protein